MSDPAPPPYAAGTTIADVLGHPDTPRGNAAATDPTPTADPTPAPAAPQANPYNFQQSWTSPTPQFSNDSLFDHIVNTSLDQAGNGSAAPTQRRQQSQANNNFDPSMTNDNDLSQSSGGNPLKSSIF